MNVEIFDTTLRDGLQGVGISYSLENKLHIATALDQLGISYLEVGNPFYNPANLAFFKAAEELALHSLRLTVFGSTRKKEMSAEEDPACRAMLDAGTPTVTIFGKSWDLHVTDVLETTCEENLRMIAETVAFLKRQGREVIFDAEHFFDGYLHNPEYALQTLLAAQNAGADKLVLCDTNGGRFPYEIEEATARVAGEFSAKIGIHCHNDTGCAVANTIAAVRAGAVHAQGTLLGIGERCGNTSLATLIPDLQLRMGLCCIPDEKMQDLTRITQYVAEQSNLIPDGAAPYVGRNAFSHKGGMHVDGVLKNPATFEHLDPELVGNRRDIMISEASGKSAAHRVIRKLDPELCRDDEKTARFIEAVKELESAGYQFESANASLELLAMKIIGNYKPAFRLLHYNVFETKPVAAGMRSASAVIKVQVDGQDAITAEEGDGPVHALDRALRRVLEAFYPQLKKIRLIDYKVRVMSPGEATAAKVRVVIDSTDGASVWTTVGVSADIIEASWIALVDSIEYRLLRKNGR